MNITKNGFYKLSEINSSKIQIESNLVVAIFDDGSFDCEIEILENSRVDFYGFIENQSDYKITFIQKENNSELKLNYLLLNGDEDILKAKIESKILSNNSKSDIKIISLVLNNGNIDLDGIIEIGEGVFGVKAKLVEENLFLGSNGKIKGVPTLLVRSDDVQASHSCKMERISDEKLFYLRSRGIGKENALNMIIDSYISDLFSCLGNIDNDFYDYLYGKIIGKIN